ncbi:CbtA family protein [Hyphomicrobium sp. 99]|uniref:CbtA family protein n=1 Tax=Hyphomicrobium sp. 99 TaxID=1163419 RepID=UPI0005F87567|nr:CbtA family protein [Hyphomicrobium sp. 99]
MGALLMRGMIAGLIASLLAFGFAKIIGEPQVDRAIAFEEAAHTPAPGEAEEPELVSRDVQASVGLLTGVALYGTALGGLFALAYAFISGRLLHLPPRSTALVIAAVGFLVLYLVPYLKYPANPPAVGQGETISYRTELYFGMIVFSLFALAIAISFGRQAFDTLGGWTASIVGAAVYLVLVVIAAYALPVINEVPEKFPADLLWNFRIASLGTQFILWAAIGLLFGWLIAGDRERLAR